jgi:hypothetical protein
MQIAAFDQAARVRVYICSTDRPSLRMGDLTLNIDGEMITEIYLDKRHDDALAALRLTS